MQPLRERRFNQCADDVGYGLALARITVDAFLTICDAIVFSVKASYFLFSLAVSTLDMAFPMSQTRILDSFPRAELESRVAE